MEVEYGRGLHGRTKKRGLPYLDQNGSGESKKTGAEKKTGDLDVAHTSRTIKRD